MDDFNKKIEELSDPKKFNHDLEIQNREFDFLVSKLSSMILIRKVEEKLALEKENGSIGGPVHLGAGQEAIAVGISEYLTKADKVFGAHRSHSHLLALNPDTRSLFAEILGKDTGFSRGMGGSMHLSDIESGFAGSVPIVSGTVPLALGAGLHYSLSKEDSIGVAYIGDGAMEEGIVHESLNLAKILNIPVLFVVENNLFASHMHISQRQPKVSVARFAVANSIDAHVLDGNNLIEIMDVAKKCIHNMRNGSGPALIEAVTYRHYGHVDFRKDIDVGVNRSQEDVLDWLKRDPILRLKRPLISKDIISQKDVDSIEEETNKNIVDAWDQALKDPYPKISELHKRVYHND